MKPATPRFYYTIIRGQRVRVDVMPPAPAVGERGIKKTYRKKSTRRKHRQSAVSMTLDPDATAYVPELDPEEELPTAENPLPQRFLRLEKKERECEPLEEIEDEQHFHLDYGHKGQREQRDEIKYTRGSWASGWKRDQR